ncbi:MULTISPECIES: restriction endonuclease subunit S [unclassified Arsenophonus]|uniref:restriction endonuclease subunit S n=1 Tax=unclassified Arsenophonus TaxID=2627083 RepID=UPI0028646E46|nr:restriction endonuclease subunit S [Arsenophonus sp.]MDR5609207.1 restriction endonuclease subunit S [Arsenophonus sp.]MDR5612939.1 restriction endonuclease subunit S [Arsenophonus sp.]
MVPDGWRLTGLDGVRASIIDGDRGKSYPKKDDYLSNGHALFIGAENIANGYFSLNKTVFISKEKYEEMRKGIVQDKDIILVMRGNGTGRSCIFFSDKIHGKVARINSGLVIIRASEEYTDVNFLHQLFLSDIIKKQFDGFIFGSAQPQLTVSLLKSLVIPIPPFYEQVKIACILSVWDKAIATTEQLLANSQQQKKALMQQLLTGKRRFLDFSGEWNQVYLGDICQPRQWATISSSDLIDSGYPVYGANGFIGYFTEFNHPLETVAITCRGSTCGEVSLIPKKSYITGNSMCLDEIDTDKNHHLFIFYLLKYRGFNDVISGSAQPQIVGKAIKKIKITVPELEEQNKIASVLAIADQETQTLKQKLHHLKQEKKALMQQLLTGKRRVKTEAA